MLRVEASVDGKVIGSTDWEESQEDGDFFIILFDKPIKSGHIVLSFHAKDDDAKSHI